MDWKSVFKGNDAFMAKLRFPSELKDDADYKKMYLRLFNNITYAISQIDRMNFGRAKDILMDAQKETEEIFISSGE